MAKAKGPYEGKTLDELKAMKAAEEAKAKPNFKKLFEIAQAILKAWLALKP